ncbi:MAG: molybdopterin-dependent oxidoreductase [Alphaproteobacteria bacterium]|nr:molybdopterin-dependent oxidoreductase [Alphaproteobacteria bacterium]
MKRTACSLLIIMLLNLVPMMQAGAEMQLPKPFGKIILTIDGNITVKNLGETAVFDRKMLEELDTITIRTSTPWDIGLSEFTGCRMSKIIEATGTDATIALISALDGYQVELPISDVTNYDPILAWARDGTIMSVREKGPLWLIYPFDSFSNLKGIAFSAKSVWQIERISFQ